MEIIGVVAVVFCLCACQYALRHRSDNAPEVVITSASYLIVPDLENQEVVEEAIAVLVGVDNQGQIDHV